MHIYLFTQSTFININTTTSYMLKMNENSNVIIEQVSEESHAWVRWKEKAWRGYHDEEAVEEWRGGLDVGLRGAVQVPVAASALGQLGLRVGRAARTLFV